MMTPERISMNALKSTLAIITMALVLSACGGEATEQLPNTSGGSGSVTYNGPSPSTDDVTNFKRTVWDNLVTQDKCGACHGANGQAPTFVNEQDVNLAYAQANTIVSLSNPSQSIMVTKVAGGHNCWLQSTSACVDILTTYITNWAGGSEGAAKTVELEAPELKEPGATVALPVDTSLFSVTVYPELRKYCSDCHADNGQTPYIASADVTTAYDQAKSRIDPMDPGASRLVERLRYDFHNCWNDDCEASADLMELKILEMVQDLTAQPVDSALVASKALTLENDGLLANSGGRFEDNVIALYEFKFGEGQTAFDTSGVSPALNLTLSGNVGWVGGWGIDLGPEGKD